MKKKVLMFIMPLLAFLIGPNLVSATSLRVSVSCNDVTVGSTTRCTVTGTTDGKINGIHGEYSINGGASFSNFSPGSGWLGEGNNGSFDLYTDSWKSNTFTIGTFTLRGDKVGKIVLTISGIFGSDENFSRVNASNAAGTFYVEAQTTTTTTTKKTTTTTRRTTTRRQNTSTQNVTNTTQTTVSPENPDFPLSLTSVTVDDFDVEYRDGVYYVTVNSDTEEVTVNATAPEGVTVVGTGKRTLTEGRNAVELIARNSQNETATYQVIITRPSDDGVYNTLLSRLQVVDYELDFDPNTFEYTVTVPFNTKEIYVIAESSNNDVIIGGDGLFILENSDNTVYVTVSYGDLQRTEYTIHIKKDYTMLILWIAIGTLGAGFIGMTAYAILSRKKAVAKVMASNNKVVAEEVREQNEQNPIADVSIGGEKVVGIGKRPVVPTRVVATQKTDPVRNVNTIPQNSNVKVVSTAPSAQVKVVKKEVTPASEAPQVSRPLTSTGAYQNEDIIITDINNSNKM